MVLLENFTQFAKCFLLPTTDPPNAASHLLFFPQQNSRPLPGGTEFKGMGLCSTEYLSAVIYNWYTSKFFSHASMNSRKRTLNYVFSTGSGSHNKTTCDHNAKGNEPFTLPIFINHERGRDSPHNTTNQVTFVK